MKTKNNLMLEITLNMTSNCVFQKMSILPTHARLRLPCWFLGCVLVEKQFLEKKLPPQVIINNGRGLIMIVFFCSFNKTKASVFIQNEKIDQLFATTTKKDKVGVQVKPLPQQHFKKMKISAMLNVQLFHLTRSIYIYVFFISYVL